MTITQWQKHFARCFGRRNRLFMGGNERLTIFFSCQVGDLQETVRHGSAEKVSRALASVVAWYFALVNFFEDLPLEGAMCVKYGLGCSYCRRNVCVCGENRPDPESVGIGRSGLSLTEWQGWLESVYGQNNRSKGWDNALNRLSREIAEVQEALQRIGQFGRSVVEAEAELTEELADVLAWIIGLANLQSINLEATLNDYYSVCGACQKKECGCGAIGFDDGGRIRRVSSFLRGYGNDEMKLLSPASTEWD